jgi:hypothetical protein
VLGHAAGIVTSPAELTKTVRSRLVHPPGEFQRKPGQPEELVFSPGAAGKLSVAAAQGVRCC